MRIDIGELKGQVNLASLVERDLGPARKVRGRWWMWCCPFHDDHNPSLGVTPHNGRWTCFGCGEAGDHIDWLEKCHALTTSEAINELQRIAGMPDMPRPTVAVESAAPADGAPGEKWQEAGRAFASWAEKQLWTVEGKPGLDYLRAGGLTDETIRYWGLGWNPSDLWQPAARWGLSGGKVFLPRGVVIPCYVAGVLWYVKVRRFDAHGPMTRSGEKYGGPRGGRGALFGADEFQTEGRPLLVCEGERDTLLAWQELRDLVDVATLGGAGRRHLDRWILWLLPYKRILVAYDPDESGEKGAAELESLSQWVVAIRVPHGKDLVDFHAAGGDLKSWLRYHFERLGVTLAPMWEEEAKALMKEDPQTPAERLSWCTRYAEVMTRSGAPCTGFETWDDWLTDMERYFSSLDTDDEVTESELDWEGQRVKILDWPPSEKQSPDSPASKKQILDLPAFKKQWGLRIVGGEWLEREPCPTLFLEPTETGVQENRS